jgi:predicted transposase
MPYFFKKKDISFWSFSLHFQKISRPVHHALAEETHVYRHGRNRRLLFHKNLHKYRSCAILINLKLESQNRLLLTQEQSGALRSTCHAGTSACNYGSAQAWSTKSFKQYDLHHLCYMGIRPRFGLSAQAAVRVISMRCKTPAVRPGI